jgi:hypothetical protein
MNSHESSAGPLRDETYAPCECGTWPTPSDQRAGVCRVCHDYRPAAWYFEARANTFRDREAE